MKVVVNQLAQINILLDKIRPINIGVETLKNLIKLKKQIKQELEIIVNTQESIFEKYNISSNPNEQFKAIKESSKREIIEQEINKLYKLEVDVDCTSFIDEEEFFSFTISNNLNLEEISILEPVLLKNNNI